MSFQGAHARLPASGTERWWACPGSLPWVAVVEVKDKSGPHAELGTCAHALVEQCLKDGQRWSEAWLGHAFSIMDSDGSAELLAAVVKRQDGNHYYTRPDGSEVLIEGDATLRHSVDEDMVAAVDEMLGYVRARGLELDLPDAGTDSWIKDGFLKVENRVVPLRHRDDTGGTADVVIDAWPEALEVIDYKHGSGVYVPVEGNKQLRTYLLGAVGGFDGDERDQASAMPARHYDAYHYTIVQPRNRRHGGGPARREEITWTDLTEWAFGLTMAAARVDDAARVVAMNRGLEPASPGAELLAAGMLTAGDHCTFCPMKAACPALKAKAGELAAVDFDDDPPSMIELPRELDELAKILEWVPALDKWLRAVEARAMEHALAGDNVPGHKVVRKRGRRVWREGADLEAIAKSLVKDFGLDPAKIMTPPELITGPAVEKLIVGRGSGAKRKEMADRWLEKQKGGFTLAMESDARQAVDPLEGRLEGAVADFDDGGQQHGD